MDIYTDFAQRVRDVLRMVPFGTDHIDLALYRWAAQQNAAGKHSPAQLLQMILTRVDQRHDHDDRNELAGEELANAAWKFLADYPSIYGFARRLTSGEVQAIERLDELRGRGLIKPRETRDRYAVCYGDSGIDIRLFSWDAADLMDCFFAVGETEGAWRPMSDDEAPVVSGGAR